jgi:hypothetical protein
LEGKKEFNKNFRQKCVAQFDPHADARCSVSGMISCCCNSPNLPMCYLLDCILGKYHPGSRITILLINPANFTVSQFHFVSYNFFKKKKLFKLKQKFKAEFVLLAEKFGIPSSSIFFSATV